MSENAFATHLSLGPLMNIRLSPLGLFFIFAIGSAGLAACSDPAVKDPEPTGRLRVATHDPNDVGEAGASDPLVPPSSGGICNALAPASVGVTLVELAENAPPVTGSGVVADGRYLLSSMRMYNGPGGKAGSESIFANEVIEVNGDTWQSIGKSRTDIDVVRGTMKITYSGNHATVVCECGACPWTAFDVSADSDGFTVRADPSIDSVFVKL